MDPLIYHSDPQSSFVPSVSSCLLQFLPIGGTRAPSLARSPWREFEMAMADHYNASFMLNLKATYPLQNW